MTRGQQRAVVELERMAQSAPDDLEFDIEEELKDGILVVRIELRIGLLETAKGGLQFRERESFSLRIPGEFPFQYPRIEVSHRRFAGFPHVTWGRWLCLYQSVAQWNPEDGLYGFFDRLHEWIGRAAMNDMDPVEGALEPPYHLTDSTQVPFVIRKNVPVPPGESWIGLAVLKRYSNRIDLVGWEEFSSDLPQGQSLALATMLPEVLPMEFPITGKALFTELENQGQDRNMLISRLTIAALLTKEGAPVHMVVGLPMRRSATGETRTHIAVWTIPSDVGDSIRKSLASDTDSEALREIRDKLADAVWKLIEVSPVYWCRILEDRSEILVRRDAGTPLSILANTKVLVLGCGALGSWVAEMLARSSPATLDLVDTGIVKPGILVRQNFTPDDYGKGKAKALADRIEKIAPDVCVSAHQQDAHRFITGDRPRFSDFDLVLDCTASSIFQMKLERDWIDLGGHSPRMISMFLDAQAQRILAMSIDRGVPAGIWDGYVRLKHRLCLQEQADLANAFYSESAESLLFQPEPGCSDPTFVGSMADVVGLSAAALNRSLAEPPSADHIVGFGVGSTRCAAPTHRTFKIKHDLRVVLPTTRIHFSDVVFGTARSFVRQNARERTSSDETGGLLWGRWDEALGIIWVFDLSGPPPDSSHDNGRFLCGTEGTQEEHDRRFERSGGTSGFIGFWHTHPQMVSQQSAVDIAGMAKLVSRIGDNQRRALMLIFGQDGDQSTAGIYVYENLASHGQNHDLVQVSNEQIQLEVNVL